MNNYFIRGFRYSDNGTHLWPVAAIMREFTRQSTSGNCLHPDVWVLDYVLLGNSKFSVGGLPWQERPLNSAHLYPPGTLYMESGEGWEKSGFILFKGESSALRRLVNNSVGFAQISDLDLKLLNLLRAGTTAAAKGNRGYWKFFTVFGEIMELLEHLSVPSGADWHYVLSNDTSNQQTIGNIAASFLEENYFRHLTLDEIAAKCQCSKSTLVHKFHQESGETVFEMLMRIRIEQSISLLMAGYPLKEIAAATGFASEFYYSRVFTKVTGVSPKVYRNRHRNGVESV